MFHQKNKGPQPSNIGSKKTNWLKISMIVNGVVFGLIVIGLISGYVIHQSDTNPQFCGLCHVMQKNVQSYLSGRSLDSVHAQAGVQCKQCHDYPLTAEIASGIKFLIGDYEVMSVDNPVLPKKKYSDEMCLKCHISPSYVASQTDFLAKNPHQSHWTDLKCSTCHISHGEQVDYCDKCHDNGGQRLTGAAVKPRSINPWATGAGSKDAPTGSQ
jgi:nitrate/TMAO reductase-like tetraheme cytochrome c subunit